MTIPKVPMICNRVRQAHWATVWRDAKRWKEWVRTIAGTANEKGRASVDIVVYRGRKQDKDNRYNSVKPVLDALKFCGWIVDDSDKWIDLTVQEQFAKPRDRRTEIEVLPVETK